MEYRNLDMDNYPRSEHFRYFSSMPNPTMGITAKIDVTDLVRFSKDRKFSFYMAMTHIACLAANRIPEFRYRTRENGIIEYRECGTSHIELLSDGTYCYCTLWHDKDWNEFIPYSAACRKNAIADPGITESSDADALYFVTTLPWINYDQVMMPVTSPVTDNPRFCWGKHEEDAKGHLIMPFTVTANHALMDGIHLGTLFSNIKDEIERI